ncbi:hypothetical protein BDZ91DRAFT_719202, partial [Kalaharituber pfeilii]
HSIHNCSSFRLAGSSLRSKQASFSFPAQTAHFSQEPNSSYPMSKSSFAVEILCVRRC